MDADSNTRSGGSWNTTPKNPFAVPNDAPPAYSAVPAPGSFAPGPQGLAPFAPGNRNVSPAPSLASVTTPEDKYAFLSTFDTIFVIDDSGSMAGRSWREVCAVLRAIAPICTAHDKDGIDIFFLNHDKPLPYLSPRTPDEVQANEDELKKNPNRGYLNTTTAEKVAEYFDTARPKGATPTGKKLQGILKPYMARLAEELEIGNDVKPVNIIVITDGCPSDDPESVIRQHAGRLDRLEAPPYQVGIQFFQVGNEPEAAEALRDLDDGLHGVRDMVDTVTWDASRGSSSRPDLTADGILKVVLGAVVRRLDRKATGGGNTRRGY